MRITKKMMVHFVGMIKSFLHKRHCDAMIAADEECDATTDASRYTVGAQKNCRQTLHFDKYFFPVEPPRNKPVKDEHTNGIEQ